MNDPAMTTERIWELLSDKLRSFLIQRVNDQQLAEDILQEVFLRIHSKLETLDNQQRITPWIFQIARNLVIDHYRSKSREAESMVEELVADAEDNQHNLNEQIAGWLPGMIAQLPENYREAVELYELQGMPQQQIADRLEISLSGAKSRVQRGREKLKSQLLDCCSFEKDRRGNLIGFSKNNDESCEGTCEC